MRGLQVKTTNRQVFQALESFVDNPATACRLIDKAGGNMNRLMAETKVALGALTVIGEDTELTPEAKQLDSAMIMASMEEEEPDELVRRFSGVKVETVGLLRQRFGNLHRVAEATMEDIVAKNIKLLKKSPELAAALFEERVRAEMAKSQQLLPESVGNVGGEAVGTALKAMPDAATAEVSALADSAAQLNVLSSAIEKVKVQVEEEAGGTLGGMDED